MPEEVIWTDLTATDSSERLTEHGTPASVHIVEQLLEQEGFRRRQAVKSCAMGSNHLVTSHDTSAFACDWVEDWWWRHGQQHYPAAASLLLLCDGGSNCARTCLFKADL